MTRDWFLHNWMYAGFIGGLLLFAVAPVVAGGLGLALLVVYIQLPVYTIHQLEEHDRDRFRRWVNEVMAGGREAMSTRAVVVINVVFVWILDLVSLYLARFVDLGLGLIAVYLTLVNAVVHIAGGVIQRRYNPGLVTAVVLFLPASILGLAVLSREPAVGASDHVLALVIVVGLHAAIGLHVRRRIVALKAA